MTTTDRTKMPTDELMGKVVAKWKGVDVPFMVTTSTVGKGITALVPIGRADVEVVDPRFDTNAALELLHWLANEHGLDIENDQVDFHDTTPCWAVKKGKHDPYGGTNEEPWEWRKTIPISGEPFRTAVCWLAVQVLGLDETSSSVDVPGITDDTNKETT